MTIGGDANRVMSCSQRIHHVTPPGTGSRFITPKNNNQDIGNTESNHDSSIHHNNQFGATNLVPPKRSTNCVLLGEGGQISGYPAKSCPGNLSRDATGPVGSRFARTNEPGLSQTQLKLSINRSKRPKTVPKGLEMYQNLEKCVF